MSKLTNAEKDKLDNTCGNLRVTKLGTHVKTLEDFVNEGVLDTRANTVVEAINELYGMIVNKDCEGITIPPPGFFTLFGNDEDGKLYVYYNNADYPPQFRHVETPGELEGTLYLYIADPLGENHYELEVGHYIAVRHLDNYYTKAQINSMFTVTVEKQTIAESGSFATYVVKQGGTQVGPKINIPKDYLVKSCSVKTCTTANVPVQGYKVGDKYIDWVINTRDGSANNEHLYLLVNEIAEPYKPDNSTITMSSGNVFSVKDGGITLVKLAPAVQNLINSKADANHAHGNITKEGKVGTTPNVPLITGTDGIVQAGSFGSGANNFARGNHGHSDLASIAYVDNQIASVEGDVVIDLESKADRDHSHGNIQNGGTIGSDANKPLITGTNGVISAGSFGTSANTFCQGNDPRLSDNRSPKTNFIDVSSTNPVDLNAIREIGFYCTLSSTGAQYVSNCPYSSTGSAPFTNNKMFYLLVEALGSGSNKPFVKQTLTYHNSNNVWVRTKNGGDADDANWSIWKKISLEGHTHQLNDVGLTKIEANADFETYKQQGFYYIDNTNAQSCDNMPFKTGGLLIVRNLVGGVSQTFQRYNGTDMWYKTYSNGEDQWSNWNKICFADHTHGNISNAGAVGTAANKPLITGTNGVISAGSFGTSANTFCQGNDSRITNAVKSACKIGFSTSSSAPGDAMNLSVAQGNPLYAFVRDANGNVPTGLAGGAFLFNGSPRAAAINSNGIMSLTMNTAGTFIIHAIVSDGDGYQVAAGFCRITVS